MLIDIMLFNFRYNLYVKKNIATNIVYLFLLICRILLLQNMVMIYNFHVSGIFQKSLSFQDFYVLII